MLARYISAPIALRYGVLQDQEFSHPFLEVGMNLYLHQQPLEYLMDVLYPYKIFSTPFLCMQIDEQKYRLSNANFFFPRSFISNVFFK